MSPTLFFFLQNVRKTLKFGGRKQMPPSAEIEALCSGRLTKRHVIILPGCIPTVLNLRPSTVVQDAVTEMMSQMDRTDPLEVEEYSLFYIHGGKEQWLRKEHYIFDLQLQNDLESNTYLQFKRTTWFFPMQRYNLKNY